MQFLFSSIIMIFLRAATKQYIFKDLVPYGDSSQSLE